MTTAPTNAKIFADHNLHVPGVVLLAAGVGCVLFSTLWNELAIVRDGVRMWHNRAPAGYALLYTSITLLFVGMGGVCYPTVQGRSTLANRIRVARQTELISDAQKTSVRRREWFCGLALAAAALGIAALATTVTLVARVKKIDDYIIFDQRTLREALVSGIALVLAGTALTAYGVYRHRRAIRIIQYSV